MSELKLPPAKESDGQVKSIAESGRPLLRVGDFPGTKPLNRVNSYLRGPTRDIRLVGSRCGGDSRLVYGQDHHLPVQYEAVSEPTFGANRFLSDSS